MLNRYTNNDDLRKSLLFSVSRLWLIYLIVFFSISGCTKYYDFSYLNKEHSLKQLGVREQADKATSAWFFLFMGYYSSETKHKTSVKFAWLHPIEKTYIFTTFNIDRLRIKIDDFIEIPTVYFVVQEYEWRGDNILKREFSESVNKDYNFIRAKVKYVIITCREDQWNPKFDMLGL